MEKYIKLLDYHLSMSSNIERKYFFKEVNIFKENPTLLNISSNTLPLAPKHSTSFTKTLKILNNFYKN